MSYWSYDPSDLDESDTDAIRELLLFHSVVVVGDDKLVLDDGTELIVIPNEGCGGCSNGYYEIKSLNGCENVITSVTLEEATKGTSRYEDETTYSIFVYAENKQINLLTVEGSDGNGYYGTGYRIRVVKPKVKV